MSVSNLVKSIQDIMRKDAGTYGDAQRLEQLGWMFFLKIFDDHEKELAELRDDYRSPLPKHLRWSSWATDEEGITGDALLDFVNNTLLPKLKALSGGADKIAGLVRMTFEDANNYMKNGTLMRQVINKTAAQAQGPHRRRGQDHGAHPHELRGCQQLHEERHPHAAGHQQDQRHRLQCLG